ncbi:hypothetical protein [Roseovarius sp. M141]|uniref:hypothetical protein n=1 Tax=Roseovarius sp. M141 TaxID=2583806 RepID=UPI0020CD9452|nr:hypothetical protein [Roseovarius sp. M141]MCQ0092457.1 hypothetical protein [Roseovarius sp. M141]
MTSNVTILFAFMAAAFSVGVYVFFRLCLRRTLRSAGLGWLICATIVLALGWTAFALDLPPRTAVFTGLILPVWLIGGLLGLLIGLIRGGRADK